MRILLADDHDLVRDALGALLLKDEPSMELVAVPDLPRALEAFSKAGPFDVVILDLRMPGMDGLSGAERMVRLAGDTPVVIMSGSARPGDVQAALRVGIRGFVPKTLAGRSLVNAVRLVASGEVYVPMGLLTQPSSSTEGDFGLSTREKDVLVELRRGRSNKEIARSLDIAETTVKLHLRSISEKLNARNRTDIVIRAIDAGIA